MGETHCANAKEIIENKKKGRERRYYEEGELGPKIDEISVGEDGVWLAEFLIDQAHDQRQVMLASIAHILYLRFFKFRFLFFFFGACLHCFHFLYRSLRFFFCVKCLGFKLIHVGFNRSLGLIERPTTSTSSFYWA